MYNTPNEKYYLTFSPSPTIYPHSIKQLSSLEIHISLIHIHIKKIHLRQPKTIITNISWKSTL